MRQHVGCISDPTMVGKHTHTYTRGTRKFRPFAVINRKDMDAAMAAGCPRCGYHGTAMRFMNVGGRTPPTLVYSSRRQFLASMEQSTLTCFNCSVEEHGLPNYRGNKKADTTGIDLSNTIAALAEE